MTCPFLKEAQVKYCQTAAVRKLIPAGGGRPARTRSAPRRHIVTCPVYRSQPAEESDGRGRARTCANR